MSNWTLFSNHGHVLVCLARDPEARLRDVAAAVGITERAVQKIVSDLQQSGMISVSKQGRRNQYRIHRKAGLRHELEADSNIGGLIDFVGGKVKAMPADKKPAEVASVAILKKAKNPVEPAKPAEPVPIASANKVSLPVEPAASSPEHEEMPPAVVTSPARIEPEVVKQKEAADTGETAKAVETLKAAETADAVETPKPIDKAEAGEADKAVETANAVETAKKEKAAKKAKEQSEIEKQQGSLF